MLSLVQDDFIDIRLFVFFDGIINSVDVDFFVIVVFGNVIMLFYKVLFYEVLFLVNFDIVVQLVVGSQVIVCFVDDFFIVL